MDHMLNVLLKLLKIKILHLFLFIFFSELEIAVREKSLAFSNLASVFAVDHWVKWISSSVSVISVMSVTVQ